MADRYLSKKNYPAFNDLLLKCPVNLVSVLPNPLRDSTDQIEDMTEHVEDQLNLVENLTNLIEGSIELVEGLPNPVEDLIEPLEDLMNPVEDSPNLVEVLLNPVEDSSNLGAFLAKFRLVNIHSFPSFSSLMYLNKKIPPCYVRMGLKI